MRSVNGAVGLLARSRLRRQWRSCVALAVLLAIGTGAGLACLAGARRTASAFERVAEATGVPDVNHSHGLPPAEAVAVASKLRGVARHETVVGFIGLVEGLDPTLFKFFIGSWDDSDIAFGRPVLRDGRYPDPSRADEVLLTGRAVDTSGVAPGDALTLRLFTSDFSEMVERRVVVTGTALDLDVAADRSQDRSSVRLTPAFSAANAEQLQAWSSTGLVVAPGADVERDLAPQLDEIGWNIDESRGAIGSRVQDALRPLTTTLALVGGLILVATVVVVGQALRRQASSARAESTAVRAMGFTAAHLRLVDLSRVLAVTVPGVVLALIVAVVLSPLFPAGALRPLEPSPGAAVDVTVLGLGALAMALLLVVGDRVSARRWVGAGTRVSTPRASTVLSGSPVASAGLHLALGATVAGRRRFWAVVWGAAVPLCLVVSAVAFVSALDRLSQEPSRYGVGWDLTARNTYGDVPPDQVLDLVEGDKDIEAVAGATVSGFEVNGTLNVPGLAVLPIVGELWPTVIEGSPPGNDDEILVGASVLRSLDAEVGDTVSLRNPFFSPTPARVTIVGTAVFPSVDLPGLDPTRLDDGLAVTWGRYQAFQSGDNGEPLPADEFVGDTLPDITFFDLADGVDPQDVVSRYPDGLPELSGSAPTDWLPSLAPLEVLETDRASGLIWAFVGLLGVTVAATIGHSVVAGVRQHRRDYGVLKALGFTRRQVITTVLWQPAPVVALALAVALPVGTALGQWSWRAFAGAIGVVDTPVVPVSGLVAVAAGSLLVVALLAAGPALIAGRAAPTLALRQE